MVTDKLPSYGAAKREVMPGVEHRQHKGLNNQAENSHQPTRRRERQMKRLIRPGLGFGSFWTARRTLAGYEVMAMVRKGQLWKMDGRDMRAQATFVAELFKVAV